MTAPSAPAARRFEGRTVRVTGAARGLGRAIAVAFAAEGAWVALGYHRGADEAEAALAEVRAHGGNGHGMTLGFDVADRAAVDSAVKRLVEERATIDVLVNNAGIARDELFPLIDPRSWDEVMAVNVTGPLHLCRAVARPMMARRSGVIVNIGSVASVRSVPGQSSYAISKAALAAMTRTLALELA